jgi:hypothetical protein
MSLPEKIKRAIVLEDELETSKMKSVEVEGFPDFVIAIWPP